MTKEIRYIIENHKFKAHWSEYLVVVVTLFCLIPFSVIGFIFAVGPVEMNERLFGLILGGACGYLAINTVSKFWQINRFVTISMNGTQAENYHLAGDLVKNIQPLEIDHDIHNYCLTVKVSEAYNFSSKYSIVPKSLTPVSDVFVSWLTIISLDNEILVNERPMILGLAFWRRRALRTFISLTKTSKASR